MATKKCEVCDTEIGESEKECPSCGVNFEELEDTIETISAAQTVAEKRKKAAAMKCTCSPAPTEGKPHKEGCPQYVAPSAPPKKSNPLRGLAAAVRKSKANATK